MDLHGIVSGYVAAVNPPLECILQESIGYTEDAAGKQIPEYADGVPIMVQCQALQYNDIMQLDGLNIQGKRLAMYLEGNWNGVVRSEQKGGDLVTLPDGSIWLCAFVFENWSLSAGWTKICATLQNGA